MELNEQATLLFNSDLDLSTVTNRLDYHLKVAKKVIIEDETIVKAEKAPIAKIVIFVEILLMAALIAYLGINLIKHN